MEHFSAELAHLIKVCSQLDRVSVAAPYHSHLHDIQSLDINPSTLEKLLNGIESVFGESAAASFVSLVSSIKDVSSLNFLSALRRWEEAAFEWDPKKHLTQAPFCLTHERPFRKKDGVPETLWAQSAAAWMKGSDPSLLHAQKVEPFLKKYKPIKPQRASVSNRSVPSTLTAFAP